MNSSCSCSSSNNHNNYNDVDDDDDDDDDNDNNNDDDHHHHDDNDDDNDNNNDDDNNDDDECDMMATTIMTTIIMTMKTKNICFEILYIYVHNYAMLPNIILLHALVSMLWRGKVQRLLTIAMGILNSKGSTTTIRFPTVSIR